MTEILRKTKAIATKLYNQNRVYKGVLNDVNKHINIYKVTIDRDKKKKALNKIDSLYKKMLNFQACNTIHRKIVKVRNFKQLEIAGKECKEEKDFRELVESKRFIKNKKVGLRSYDYIIQQSLVNFTALAPIGLKIEVTEEEAEKVFNDANQILFNERIREIIIRLFQRAENYDNFDVFNVQFKVLIKRVKNVEIDENGREIIEYEYLISWSPVNSFNKISDFYKDYGTDEEKDKEFKLYRDIVSEPPEHIIIGFKILVYYQTEEGRLGIYKKNTIENLKAFNPSNNVDFHKLTSYSTTDNKICIYESFLYLLGKIKKVYRTVNNIQQLETNIYNYFDDEPEEIKTNIKNGCLKKSLELLTKKYNEVVYIIFHRENNIIIMFDNGIMSNVDKIEHNNRTLIYSSNDEHIAPYKFEYIKNDDTEKEKDKGYKYSLHPNKLKNIKSNIDIIISFDMETYSDNVFKQTVFNTCVYGYDYKKNEHIKKSFYGIGCEREFIDYIISLSTKKNLTSTRPKEQIGNIYIYGFNNSRFDNFFIFNYLKSCVNYVDIHFGENQIKYINFDNVHIYDLNLFYTGSLSKVIKNFGLEYKKGIYPYKFVNKDNINYVGIMPHLKFWNCKKDYDEYVNNSNYDDVINFNLENYTKKYCMNDAKLTFLIAEKHIKNSSGVINGRNYDTSMCQTVAKSSLKIFQDVFLNEPLYSSPEHILNIERLSYYGGRTDVFKKMYKGDNILYYVDRNSSYPASMLGLMPVQYVQTVQEDDTIIRDYKYFKDTNLYYASSKYTGSNKNIINNLIHRDEKGNIKSKLDTDFNYYWGIELKENVLNGFDVRVKNYNMYINDYVFNDFSKYFYNERKKAKDVNNLSLSEFYKTLLNSLSGKFGQRVHTKHILINSNEDIKINNITSFEEIDDQLLISYDDTTEDKKHSVGNLVRFISYITASARSELSKIMRDVGHENVYYCDTDSIFTTKKPDESFLSQTDLGKWKIEKEISEAYFIGKKSYAYKTTTGETINKTKGVDGSLIEFDDFIKISNGHINHIKQTKDMFFKSYTNGVYIKPQERTITAN
jgi:hypothetical protein